ncbi:MAG: hypothetical protein QM831_11820 [Kofleriaceae bacterium]
MLRTPRGDVDGLMLKDGTVVRIPPHVLGTSAPPIGTRVRADGTLVGKTLMSTAATVAGNALSFDPPAQPPPPPDPNTPALANIDETSTIATIVTGPEGQPDALLLDDGATVVIGPPLSRTTFRVGDKVHAKGEGGSYVTGSALHARTLEVGGKVYEDQAPLPPPPPPR